MAIFYSIGIILKYPFQSKVAEYNCSKFSKFHVKNNIKFCIIDHICNNSI